MIKENLSKRSANPFWFFKFLFLAFILLDSNACQKRLPNVRLISLDACLARELVLLFAPKNQVPHKKMTPIQNSKTNRDIVKTYSNIFPIPSQEMDRSDKRYFSSIISIRPRYSQSLLSVSVNDEINWKTNKTLPAKNERIHTCDIFLMAFFS